MILTAMDIIPNTAEMNVSQLNVPATWDFLSQLGCAWNSQMTLPPMSMTVCDAIGKELYQTWYYLYHEGHPAHRDFERGSCATLTWSKFLPASTRTQGPLDTPLIKESM